MNLEDFRDKAAKSARKNREYLQALKKSDPRSLDEQFHAVHEAVFSEMDCLTCANCCKTTSPIFYAHDIERVAGALRMKPGDFIAKYLRIDEDGDYVLKSAPCPFLGDDNHCSVYAARPRACREYPHTDRKKMIQLLDLTYRNTLVCPAVWTMVERMREGKDR